MNEEIKNTETEMEKTSKLNEKVFIAGYGTYYRTEEIAKKPENSYTTKNSVGKYIDTLTVNGKKYYRELARNIWN